MKRVFVFAAAVLLVLAVSGCVEGAGGLMGMGAEEEDEPDDVLVVRNELVEPTVRAEETFEFSFELANLFEFEPATNTKAVLYDTGRCDLDDDKEQNLDSILEGSTRVVEWELDAPNNQQLGDMTGVCPLKYYVEYDFHAHTRADLYVLDDDYSRDDEVAQVSPGIRRGRGPLKIDVDFGGRQPFRQGSTIPFQVTLRNVGEGDVDGEISPVDINITIDYGDHIDELGSDNYEDGDWEDIGTGCKQPMEESTKGLPFIDGSTPPISCRIYEEEYSEYFSTPISSFQIDVDIDEYRYTLYGENSVTVEPTF